MTPKIIRLLLIYGILGCVALASLNVFVSYMTDWYQIFTMAFVCVAGLYYYERVYMPEYTRKTKQIAEEEQKLTAKAEAAARPRRRKKGSPKADAVVTAEVASATEASIDMPVSEAAPKLP